MSVRYQHSTKIGLTVKS